MAIDLELIDFAGMAPIRTRHNEDQKKYSIRCHVNRSSIIVCVAANYSLQFWVNGSIYGA